MSLQALVAFWFVKPLFSMGRQTGDHPSEFTYDAPEDGPGKRRAFPALYTEPTLALSLIVPAYNEEDRLPDMMDEMLAYLSARDSVLQAMGCAADDFEIIIVDDGSRDATADVAMRYVREVGSERVRLLRLHQNNGKGGAVRKGMMRARGRYLLMVDADGATRASDLGRLMRQLRAVERDGMGVAVGSRAHIQDEAVASRAWYRNVLMFGFHALVSVCAGGHGVRDTQCGFKLFTRGAALQLFPSQHIDRWAFDVELLYLCVRLAVPIVEVAVNWTEIPGSKLDILSSTVQMARDIVLIRFAYLVRLWKPAEEGRDRRSFLFKKRTD